MSGRGVDGALAHLAANPAERTRALAELVAIPSVSSDPRRAPDMRCAARLLARSLARAGLDRVSVARTRGHPLVLAEHRRRPGGPCLLIYGHYDVVPAGRRRDWSSPPFTPTIDGRFMYGRGVSDDKGPLLCHVAALSAWLRGPGRLPIDVVCLFDGEEEIGSPGLRSFVRTHGRRLGATAAVVSDTRALGADRPTLVTSLRGKVVCDVAVAGPRRDLHSGQYGGAVNDPANVLAGLLASLHDSTGRVAIPGFYDAVRPVPAAERARLARHVPSDAAFLSGTGVREGAGEAGFSAFERAALRPSLTVSRLAAGGRRTDSIIPSRAAATVSLRLVADQRPAEIARQLRRHLADRTPPSVTTTIATRKASPPWTLPHETPQLRAAARALAASFPHPPVVLPSGGTIAVVSILARLGLPVIMMGFARPDDGMHGPDERADLTLLDRGAGACARLLAELAAPDAQPRDRPLELMLA
jgi:acetylornithine deacetylase/succinyl-diaminopimelate desuccinylase-like protein